MMRRSLVPASSVCIVGTLIALLAEPGLPLRAQGATGFSIATYNISGGKGAAALAGHTCAFTEGMNCTDASKPMNAWGAGVIQEELRRVASSHPRIAGLVLDESYQALCAGPSQVQKALGWKGHVAEQNGVSAVSRFGLKGKPEWLLLDTTRNENPKDTMWVVRVEMCLDEVCRATIPVYATHWYGTGSARIDMFNRQADQAIAFMAERSKNEPHLLVGDLNVWDGETACGQTPVPSAVQKLRAAGYVDAWTAVHGNAEGFTAILNRNGCGTPNGNPWKRIDYVWAKNMAAPIAAERFGLAAHPGDCAPSDHAGLVVDYPQP